MDRFFQMTGYEFEDFIAKLFKNKGFLVETTSYSNDGGIDLIATYEEPIFSGKYIIQCKNWVNLVGQPEVRDLYGVVMDQRANKGILITPSDFTTQAYQFAHDKNIELISGDILNTLISMNETYINQDEPNEQFKDERYYFLKQNINDDPDNAKNYFDLIVHLRASILDRKHDSCNNLLFEELIEINNKMINRCLKGSSKSKYRERALLLQVEFLILKGDLIEATQLLLKLNKFFIGTYTLRYHENIARLDKGIKGWNFDGVFTWNLYSAFKYINYTKGLDLILSNSKNTDYHFETDPFEKYKNDTLKSTFIFPHIQMNAVCGKVDYFDVSLFFEDEFVSAEYFFKKFYTKTQKEYADELDKILKLNGII